MAGHRPVQQEMLLAKGRLGTGTPPVWSLCFGPTLGRCPLLCLVWSMEGEAAYEVGGGGSSPIPPHLSAPRSHSSSGSCHSHPVPALRGSDDNLSVVVKSI